MIVPGREFDGRRGVLQNQTQHEAEQAAGGVCEQGGQGRRQHSVRVALFRPAPLLCPVGENAAPGLPWRAGCGHVR